MPTKTRAELYGLDTASWLPPDAVLDSVQRSEAVIYGMSAGRGSERFLQALAKASGGESIDVDRTANLSARWTNILDTFRQRYLLSYSPRGVERGGWHHLDVRLPSLRVHIQARPGRYHDTGF